MIPCHWNRCRRRATVSVDGWLFLDPIDYCGQHAEAFMAELGRMGWTRPFYLAGPGAPREGRAPTSTAA
jgi:hypothetical protein